MLNSRGLGYYERKELVKFDKNLQLFAENFTSLKIYVPGVKYVFTTVIKYFLYSAVIAG